MSLKEPESAEEVVYFTNRALENEGRVKAWAYRIYCPECKKALMGKPVEKGKIKRRAKYYICPECEYNESDKEHEAKLTLEVVYKCPHCSNEGETTTEYKRKTFQGVPSFIFKCLECGQKIGITKKMKTKKGAKKTA
ncbi:MAG: hypothetical protein ACOCQG_00260 [Candidatus Nanoarchaeia archaeon]